MSADDELEQPTRSTFRNPSRASLSSRGRKGAFTAHAARTPEERTELARKAAAARWTAENARRATEGRKPTKPSVPEMSANDLEPWLDEVDRLFPDRTWANAEQRRRQAILLARKAAADLVGEALRNAGKAGT